MSLITNNDFELYQSLLYISFIINRLPESFSPDREKLFFRLTNLLHFYENRIYDTSIYFKGDLLLIIECLSRIPWYQKDVFYLWSPFSDSSPLEIVTEFF